MSKAIVEISGGMLKNITPYGIISFAKIHSLLTFYLSLKLITMKSTVEMKIVNPHSGGIDIGSRSHHVAVGQGIDDLKEFGVSHTDHLELLKFLNSRGVKTIAMESTGSYWQSLYLVLIGDGIDVLLVPGTQTKGFRKTDVKDARQLQQLHALGLLTSCFLPDDFTSRVRELSRHRKSLIRDCSKYTNRIQKCLRLMNVRLDVVISDINGVTGTKIIEAILMGERNPEVLATLSDKRVKRTKEEIADALHGNFQDELMYELKDVFELYKIIQEKLNLLDQKLSQIFELGTNHIYIKDNHVKLTIKQSKGKNQPKIGIQEIAYKLYGTDLSAIPGLGPNTLLSIITELGTSIDKFSSSKSFVSWLRLAPNNKISGSRILSSRTPKGVNPLSIALRDCANVIGNQRSGHLTNFFKRVGLKKGRCAAITATARKLGTIIYNMIAKKVPYNPEISEHIMQKIKARKIKAIKVLASECDFLLIDNQGIVVS